jgi:hypothetical protein
VGTVGSAIEIPMPETSRASVSSTQLVASVPLTATQVKPAVSRASPVTMTGRRPVLSDRAPASGEMIIGMPKNGSSRRPVDTGE